MDWWIILLIIGGALLISMASGMPVAFCFWLVNVIGVFFFMGGGAGLTSLMFSVRSSLDLFPLIAAPLFILMGIILFEAGIASRMLDVFDMWLGRVPGRLSVIAVGMGTLLAAISGSNFGTVAMLGASLGPEMTRRGYKNSMIVGPILGGGGLGEIIPPSMMIVLLAVLAQVSVGKLLIAGVIPGLLLASLFATYIIVACVRNPTLAPAIAVSATPLSKKLVALVRFLLPTAAIVFLVLGVIFTGAATPTEASALGALGCFILAATYKRLDWRLIKASVTGTTRITVMILIILTGSVAFSQLLVYTGITRSLAGLAAGLTLAPTLIIMIMLAVILVMGMFIDSISIMMIAVPIYVPVVTVLGFDPIAFGILLLLALELGGYTPPFGLGLFLIKGIMPQIPMGEIIRAVIPYIVLVIVAILLILFFPAIASWLPGMMMGA